MVTTVTLEQLAAQGIQIAPSPLAATMGTAFPAFSATPTPTPLAASNLINFTVNGKVKQDTPQQAVIGLLFSKELSEAQKAYRPIGKASLAEMIDPVNRVKVANRPGGGSGNHYHLVYEMDDQQATELVRELEKLADKPKGRSTSTSRGRNFAPQQAAAPAADPRIDRMEAMLSQLAAKLYGDEPVLAPAAGHTQQPATPVVTADIGNGEQLVVLSPHQPVVCTLPDGSQELRYVSPDGLRTNKMPSN